MSRIAKHPGPRSLDDLTRAGLTSPGEHDALAPVAARYAIAITPDMAALIDRSDPADPIARQFVPTPAELDRRPEELDDPIADTAMSPVKGVVHRYPDRVLLKAVHACPVYCRFCFRREMVGPGGEGLSGTELDAALAYIAGDPAIWEVILTGGDPLVLSPRRMADLLDRLGAIDHVKVARVHSRVPVVDPDRLEPAMVAALAGARQSLWLAIHTNHVRELTPRAEAAIGRLRRAGVTLVSQTVLLRGVNDDAATLAALFRRLVELGVKPYYLHQADLAPGTSHFRTSVAEGRAIMARLRRTLSGLALPVYIFDPPDGSGKVPLDLGLDPFPAA